MRSLVVIEARWTVAEPSEIREVRIEADTCIINEDHVVSAREAASAIASHAFVANDTNSRVEVLIIVAQCTVIVDQKRIAKAWADGEATTTGDHHGESQRIIGALDATPIIANTGKRALIALLDPHVVVVVLGIDG